MPVPEPDATVSMEIFGTKVDAVPARDAAHSWCGDYLGLGVRLVHMDDPATRRPVDPSTRFPARPSVSPTAIRCC